MGNCFLDPAHHEYGAQQSVCYEINTDTEMRSAPAIATAFATWGFVGSSRRCHMWRGVSGNCGSAKCVGGQASCGHRTTGRGTRKLEIESEDVLSGERILKTKQRGNSSAGTTSRKSEKEETRKYLVGEVGNGG